MPFSHVHKKRRRCAALWRAIRQFLHTAAEQPQRYTQRDKDFTRHRCLDFFTVALLSLKLLKKSLQCELFDLLPPEKHCTKQALRKARRKIKPLFFADFFDAIAHACEQHLPTRRLRGYRLWACDSTVQSLPDNEETRKIGVHKNQHRTVASCKLSVYFDVHNKLITRNLITDKRTSDIYACAENQIATIPSDVISIYDRGYTSHLLFYLHQRYGSHFVVRARLGFNKAVKKFVKSDENEQVIEEKLQYKCRQKLQQMGIETSAKETIRYRMVKVVLPTGDLEVLITNLPAKKFPIVQLAEIYRLRWGIEVCFNSLKNQLMLGTFSGYSECIVKQDIWCNLIFYNLLSISLLAAEEDLEIINNRRKQNYRFNRNIAAYMLRKNLSQILLATSSRKLFAVFDSLIPIFLSNLERIKTTKLPRKRKPMRVNDRHHTELNYKRGF